MFDGGGHLSSATSTVPARGWATIGILFVEKHFWMATAADLMLGAKASLMADHAMMGGGHCLASKDVK